MKEGSNFNYLLSMCFPTELLIHFLIPPSNSVCGSAGVIRLASLCFFVLESPIPQFQLILYLWHAHSFTYYLVTNHKSDSSSSYYSSSVRFSFLIQFSLCCLRPTGLSTRNFTSFFIKLFTSLFIVPPDSILNLHEDLMLFD